MKRIAFLFLGLFAFAEAMYEGNPTDMLRMKSGLIKENCNYRFHSSYVYDNIYNESFHEKFDLASNPSNIRIRSNLACVGLDLYGYVGFYGFVGASKLKMEELIETSESFAWSGGMKAVVFRMEGFTAALDGRYFRVSPAVDYLVIEKNLFPVASKLRLKLEEIQGAFIMSYVIGPCMPYAGVSYIWNQIDPLPPNGLFRMSGVDELFDFEIKTNINKQKWGPVIGLNLFDKGKASITCEARFVNQSAISAALDLRF